MENHPMEHDAVWHDAYDAVYAECRALGEHPTWADLHAMEHATYVEVKAREQQAGADAQTAHTAAVAASQLVRAEIEAEWRRQDHATQAAIDATDAYHWRLWHGLDDDDPDAMDLPQPEPNSGTAEVARGDRSQPAATQATTAATGVNARRPPTREPPSRGR